MFMFTFCDRTRLYNDNDDEVRCVYLDAFGADGQQFARHGRLVRGQEGRGQELAERWRSHEGTGWTMKNSRRNWLNVEGLTKELAERGWAHKLGHALALLDVGLRGRPQRRRRALLHAETTLTTRLHPDVLRVMWPRSPSPRDQEVHNASQQRKKGRRVKNNKVIGEKKKKKNNKKNNKKQEQEEQEKRAEKCGRAVSEACVRAQSVLLHGDVGRALDDGPERPRQPHLQHDALRLMVTYT